MGTNGGLPKKVYNLIFFRDIELMKDIPKGRKGPAAGATPLTEAEVLEWSNLLVSLEDTK